MAIWSILSRGGEESAALSEAFARERRRGALLSIAGCGLYLAFNIVSAIVDAMMSSPNPTFARFPNYLVDAGLVSCLAPVPIYLIARRSKFPLAWCFVAMIVDLLVISQLKFFWLWQPEIVRGVPMFLAVRYQDYESFLVVLMIYTLSLSRHVILLGGVAIVVVWIACVVRAFAVYGAGTIYWGPFGSYLAAGGLRRIMDPGVLVADFFAIQILLIGAVAAFLALVIGQARQFVIARVKAEGEVASLAKFFAPAVAARIAGSDSDQLGAARRHVAILFIKIDAGSGLAESLDTIQRRYTTIEQVVFNHGGVLDRFTGGAAMAVFGALEEEVDAPGRALRCATQLVQAPTGEGEPAVISLHAGLTVCGELGGGRGRTFSVIGDPVNVARRILDVAEGLGGGLVVSDDLFKRLKVANGAPEAFIDLGKIDLKGHAPMRLWRHRR